MQSSEEAKPEDGITPEAEVVGVKQKRKYTRKATTSSVEEQTSVYPDVPKFPPWLEIAWQYIGLKEVKGSGTNPVIRGWLARLGAWWSDDDTPWCGVALAEWFSELEIEVPKLWMRAKSWLDWGVAIPEPVVGCVVVFSRYSGGHVGLVVGRSDSEFLMVLGGNQGDAVRVSEFDVHNVLGYRWPRQKMGLYAYAKRLPVIASADLKKPDETKLT